MQLKQTETKQQQQISPKTTVQTQRSTGKNETTRPNGVGSKTGIITKTKQANGKNGEQLGNNGGRTTGEKTGERKLGNKRHGAATGLTGRLGKTGRGQTRGGPELTGQLGGGEDETATELIGRPG